jgi:hypothetical protein
MRVRDWPEVIVTVASAYPPPPPKDPAEPPPPPHTSATAEKFDEGVIVQVPDVLRVSGPSTSRLQVLFPATEGLIEKLRDPPPDPEVPPPYTTLRPRSVRLGSLTVHVL